MFGASGLLGTCLDSLMLRFRPALQATGQNRSMKSDLETTHFAFVLLVRFCGHSLPGAFVKALGRLS